MINLLSVVVVIYIWFKASFTLWPWLIALANSTGDMALITTLLILSWPFVIISIPGGIAMMMAGDLYKTYTK